MKVVSPLLFPRRRCRRRVCGIRLSVLPSLDLLGRGVAVLSNPAPASPSCGSSSFARAVSFLRPCQGSRPTGLNQYRSTDLTRSAITPFRLIGSLRGTEGGLSSMLPKKHRKPPTFSWQGNKAVLLYISSAEGLTGKFMSDNHGERRAS